MKQDKLLVVNKEYEIGKYRRAFDLDETWKVILFGHTVVGQGFKKVLLIANEEYLQGSALAIIDSYKRRIIPEGEFIVI